MGNRGNTMNLTGITPYYFNRRDDSQQKEHPTAGEGFDKILEQEQLKIRENLEHGLKLPEQSKRN